MTDHTLQQHDRPDLAKELWEALADWQARRKQRRQIRRNLKALKKLDKRTLEDIGMNPRGLRGAGHALELTVLTAGRLDPHNR
ncbi:MAG: hypothetical protein R3316_02435 [Rhodovibrionaceae bacterium]|nr:hypothetical protein [Rhodovibrionaceae bacterium]